jgi:hypothetical protein
MNLFDSIIIFEITKSNSNKFYRIYFARKMDFGKYELQEELEKLQNRYSFVKIVCYIKNINLDPLLIWKEFVEQYNNIDVVVTKRSKHNNFKDFHKSHNYVFTYFHQIDADKIIDWDDIFTQLIDFVVTTNQSAVMRRSKMLKTEKY